MEKRPADIVLEELENMLDWRLKQTDRHEWETLQDYSKVVSDLCITIDTIKYYYDTI